MEELFFQYNPHWEGKSDISKFKQRKRVLDIVVRQLSNRQIIFLTGLRRIGKTTLMKMLIHHLISKEKVRPNNIFYFSMDNYLVHGKTLFELIKTYKQIHELKNDDFTYLFLDEITYQKDFEIQLKNLYDLGYYKIIASSSNASLFKSRKPFLTGRSTLTEVQALDYNEYLDFKEIKLSRADSHLHEKHFLDFLKTGGIPEYVLTADVAYIQDLVNDIIYKDIVAQHQLKNPTILQDFFLLLMERAGKQFSINKMASILGISTETAKRYLDYFTDTYLIYLVERYGKTNERLLSPKKIYAADLGIRNFFTGFRDIGALFENYVYLKIKSLKPRYLYQDRTEIDFVAGDMLIEVKYKNAEMNTKQQKLFEGFPAKKKVVVSKPGDIDELYST